MTKKNKKQPEKVLKQENKQPPMPTPQQMTTNPIHLYVIIGRQTETIEILTGSLNAARGEIKGLQLQLEQYKKKKD